MVIELKTQDKERTPLSDLAVQFSAFMLRLNTENGCSAELELAAWLVSQRLEQGHVCLDLRVASGCYFYFPGQAQPVKAPGYAHWLKALHTSSVVGQPSEFCPLILDQKGRLYLQRYWRYELSLAQAIAAKIRPDKLGLKVNVEKLKQGVQQLFPATVSNEPDWQRVAAINAVLRRFCVISGGPGTGKTTTVIKLLVLMVQQALSPLRIVLGAPTGKAAARLQDSIRHAKKSLAVDQEILNKIPDNAETLHRLLGITPGLMPQRRKKNLVADVFIVDEASMIDLSMMVKLIEILPADCRLILLGDKNQLNSISAGSVLSDLCQETGSYSATLAQQIKQISGDLIPVDNSFGSAIQDSVMVLKKSYRFKKDSGIEKLARYTLLSDASSFCRELKKSSSIDICWLGEKRGGGELNDRTRLAVELAAGYQFYFQSVKNNAIPRKLFFAFNRFRILAAHRHGLTGVEGLNGLTEQAFKKQCSASTNDEWYVGRPVMILENNEFVGLANGDVGLVLRSVEHNNELRVFFENSRGGMTVLHPQRLPRHETAFAITVHKSQGSEFEELMFVLPEEDMPILNRELVYTAITRAQKKIILSGSEHLFIQILKRRGVRSSGLVDQIKHNECAE
ncbi:MAG: exodeoxyribonuclease V subunit alpha [Gammaproteobacteria bacterium]|nr:exodeoxyribonuclease V subunit alpha [Gammaproteobacteria bacterium]